jgi:hypothetical protein
MAQPILVTQSTSIVQVDTSQVVFGSPAVVLLSSLNAPGTLVTIRDIAGLASTNKGVIVSTTQGVHFLDGPSCNIYTINQPYGFLTVTPKASSIWAVTNTFAFPEGSTAANVNQFTANFATISSLFANQALMSTVGISTLSTDTTQVRYNLSVGQSTIADSVYVKGSLTALSSISTAGSIYAASSLTTRDALLTGHLQASCIQVQQSTGFALQVAGAAQFASTVSVLRDVYVGGNISTQGDLVVGGNFAINGGLQLTGLAITGGVSTSGTLGVAKDAQFLSSLLVKDDGYFYRSVSVASNLLVEGSISTLSSLAASSISARGQAFVGTNLSVMSSLYAGGNVSVGGDLAVAGNLIFNDVLLDLNALSVFSTLTVGAFISTTGSMAAGGGLRVMGSTILEGLVSTASSMNIGGSLSTTGNLAVGGSATFFSSLSVRGAVTKLGDVNIGGVLSTQSSLIVGDSIRVNSNLFIGGVISSVSSINAAGSLLVGGQTFLSSGLSTLGVAAFFSSVQIQGSVSVMSSMVVRADMTVQGTLNASGFSLPGAAAVASLGVQTSTGVSAVFGGSTVQTGLLSTLGGINMGGQFSTPNTITTGSTLNARFVVATSNISTLGSLGVGGDMGLSGRGTFCNLTVTSNLQTTAASSNVFAGCNIFAAAPYFSNGFNGDLTQNYSMGNVTAAGTLQVSQGATFSNQVTAQSNLNTSSLTVTGNTLMSNFTSTLGQAAFFSSVAIQGGLSVFSSVAVSCNLTVGGTLTAGSFQLPGGAILQTLAVTSNSGFTVNISSSTLHAGLFSTSGAIFSGREISTTSSLMVGGVGYFQAGISTLGQAAFASNVQVDGGLVSLSTVIGPNISASKLQASSLGLGVATSSNVLDVAGTAAIQGTGRSNTLRLTATDASPGITLSNATANYTLFNTTSADVPGAGALAVIDNAERFRIAMFPNGNTAIGKSSASAPLDVNGLAIADTMGAPLAQFSTLGAITASASTLNVLSNINVTANTGAGGVYALDITSGTNGIRVRTSGTSNATLTLGNTSVNNGLTLATVGNAGEWATDAVSGDSVIRVENNTNSLLFACGPNNATLAVKNGSVGIGTVAPTTTLDVVGTVNARTSLTTPSGSISTLSSSNVTVGTSVTVATRKRIIYIGGTFLLYSTDGGVTYDDTGVATGGTIISIATNGVTAVAIDNAGSLAYAPDGISFQIEPSFTGTGLQILWDGRRYIMISNTPGATLFTSPTGSSWSQTNPFGGKLPNCIAFNGFVYMVGCSDGSVLTSRNLINWSSPYTTNLSACYAITWTGTRWLVGGQDNSIVYSSLNDGVTWTAVSGFTTSFNTVSPTIGVSPTAVVIGNGYYGGGSVIGYSLDSGQTFTFITPAAFSGIGLNYITGISWVGDRFIITGSGVGDTPGVFQSFDGISWSFVSTPYDSQFGLLPFFATAFTYSTELRQTINGALAVDTISTTGTLTVADTLRVGPSTMVVNPLYANVGINCNAPRFTLDVNGNINAGGNLYVAGTVFQGGGSVGTTLSTSRFFTSSLVTSTLIANTTTILSNSQTQKWFVASIQRSTGVGVLLRSPDGITWNTVTSPNSNFAAFAYSFNGTRWVMGGRVDSAANSGSLYTSIDGSNWSQVIPTGYANSFVWDIQWNGQYYLISGIDNTSGSSNTRCITKSTDLTSFSASATAAFTGGTCRQTAWNGNLWVAVGRDAFVLNSSQCIKYSTDGSTWTAIPGGGFTNSSSAQGFCVIWNGRMFVAGGADSTASVSAAVMKYSYDGIAWYDGQGVVGRRTGAGQVNSIAWSGQRFVATCEGARFTNFLIYSDDGINWQNTNGTFTSAGGRVVWNGTRWVATGVDTTAGKVLQTSTDGINWSNSSGNTETSPFTVAVGWSSNVFPDAQIGNMFVYNNQANNFTTSPTSTNTIQLFSNAMLLNEMYTDTTGKVGINCNAPGGSALAVNGFVTMSNQSPINVVVIGTNDTTAANQLKYSLDYGQNWNNCILNPAPATNNGTGAIAWNGSYFLGVIFTSATSGSFYSSSNGVVWNSNPMLGESNMRSVRGLVWAPPYWVAVGQNQLANNSNTSIIRSLDGITWSRASSGGFASTFGAGYVTGSGQSIAFNGRRLVATGQDITNSQIKYSDDLGATWITAYGYSQQPFNVIRTVATNGRVWVASALSGGPGVMMYSTDGANWVPTTFRFPGAVNIGIEWNGSVFVATGANGNTSGIAGLRENADKSIAYSYDGINWLWASNAFIYGADGRNVVWTGRNYVAMGHWNFPASTIGTTGFFRIKTSVDGITWSNVTTTQNPSWTGVGGIAALAYSSNVYADLQVENLAIYGRNQFPFPLSTNRINLSSSNMTINNGIVISSNGRIGYGTTNPGAAFDVLGGGGADNLFVTTIAGSLTGASGAVDGYTTSALLNRPIGVAVDSNQNVYFSEINNNRIRIAFSNGVVSTLCGGTSGSADGVGSLASFRLPHGICIDVPQQNLYVCDYANHTIRKVVIATGTVTTVAGTAQSAGFSNGTGAAARFANPIAIVSSRDNNTLYISDNANNAIRRIDSGNVVTTFAGQATAGRVDGIGTAARFSGVNQIAITATTLYIADTNNNMIRSAVLSTSNVSTLTGSPTGGGTSAGAGAITQGTRTGGAVWLPQGVALSPGDGTLYINNTGTGNGTISAYDLNANFLSVYINGGLASSINVIDGAIGTAKFNGTRQLTTDQIGNIYLAEDNGSVGRVGAGNRIRKITSNYTSSIAALSFDYSGGGLSHYVRSRHMPTDGRAAENAIDFFLNTSFNTLSSISTGSGNVLAASITAAGIGIGTATPCNMLHVTQNLPYSYRALNPLPAQVMIGSVSATMKLGTYYTAGQGIAGTIQVADSYWGDDRAPNPLLLNPLGGNVGIGTDPVYALDVSGVIQASIPGAPAGGIMRLQPGLTGNILRYGGTADILQFVGVGNVERMRIFGANVGINISTPSQMLHMNGGGLYITGNATNYGDTNSASFWNQSGIGPTIAGANIAFNTNGTTERMRITSAGNVGIGTTAPAATLHVASSNGRMILANNSGGGASGVSTIMIFSNNSYNTAAITSHERAAFNGGAWRGAMAFHTYGNTGGVETLFERMRINEAGNVGIGTAAPQQRLHISNGQMIIDNGAATAGQTTTFYQCAGSNVWQLGRQLGSNTGTSGGFFLWSTPLSDILWEAYHNGTMYFRSNVGIGTNNPTYTLHLHKAATSQDVRIMLSDNTTGTGAADGFQMLKGSDQNCFLFNYENSFLQFGTNGAARMTILAGGNVGINTTNPTALLHVNGNISQTVGAGFQMTNFNTQSWGSATANVSIYATHAIWSGDRFIATSDQRVKKNIKDAPHILSTLLSIPIRSFDYRDPSNTDHVSHGVIAQELLPIYPELVQKNTEFIPNILEESQKIEYISTTSSVRITISSPHGLSTTGRVSLTTRPDFDASGNLSLGSDGKPTYLGENHKLDVLEVNSESTITVKAWDKFDPARPVKLVGKEVDDFLTVDKPLLGVLALAGVKELYQELLETKSTLAALLAKYPV